jgi:hypothetical protein
MCEIFSQYDSGERCGPWASCFPVGMEPLVVLHLGVVVRQECQVICKVEVIKLCPESLLYTVVPVCHGGLHDPVNDQEEEVRQQYAALTYSSVHLETDNWPVWTILQLISW